MMTVYSEVAKASGRGRRVERVGRLLAGVVAGVVVVGVCGAAMAGGVVECFRFFLVTVAHVTGLEFPRGGKATLWGSIESAEEMESWEGGNGRVSTGGWEVKRTCLGGGGGALYFLKEGQSDSGSVCEGVCSAHLQKCEYFEKNCWNSAAWSA
jgi:hypothetical protein